MQRERERERKGERQGDPIRPIPAAPHLSRVTQGSPAQPVDMGCVCASVPMGLACSLKGEQVNRGARGERGRHGRR